MPTQPKVKDAVLMANVSRRYFVHDQSKSEIADVLGISRFRVARLLARARETGIVRIEVGLPGLRDNELGQELGGRFGLRHVVILDVPEERGRDLLRKLGVAAIELLGEILTADDVLGLASARPLLGIGDEVGAFPSCPVVQLTGAISRPDALDIIQCIRDITRAGGGEAYVYYAPILGATAADVVRQNPDVERAVAMFPRLTAVVLGVGAWAPGLSTVTTCCPRRTGSKRPGRGSPRRSPGSISMPTAGRSGPTWPTASGRRLRRADRVGVRIGIAFGRGKAPRRGPA